MPGISSAPAAWSCPRTPRRTPAACCPSVEYKLEHHYKRAGFMTFGISQFGQAAASLGKGELAYQALVRLVNSYWTGNLASTHNPRWGFIGGRSWALMREAQRMVLAKPNAGMVGKMNILHKTG
jgi:hypothetical protein